jgi:hypothetical protein
VCVCVCALPPVAKDWNYDPDAELWRAKSSLFDNTRLQTLVSAPAGWQHLPVLRKVYKMRKCIDRRFSGGGGRGFGGRGFGRRKGGECAMM